MRMLPIALIASLASFGPAKNSIADSVAAFVRERLHVSSYQRADADLNDDGDAEAFVFVTDPNFCGSGGCVLIVLSPHKDSFRVVLRSTVTRPPITLLRTSTRGWRDVGVTVAGGGIAQPYTACLQFDGRRYPSNPTVPQATTPKQPAGTVLTSGYVRNRWKADVTLLA